VKVHHDEGVANHIDPESCAVTREGLGEALTGERIGQPSSRPKRGQHDALDALVIGISTRRVNFIFDADVASLFDSVSKEWLTRFAEHRIGDKRIIRLIRKWLKAGVLEPSNEGRSVRRSGQKNCADNSCASM
jgi:hypothetical protein